MKQTRTALLALLLLAAPTVVQAQFTYTVNPGGTTVTITGYTGPGGPVTIPIHINNLLVNSIGIAAFQETGVTSVTIPDSVTSIGENAFTDCFSLTSVTIPDSVISIGDDVFLDCTRLTSATIPNSVTNIGDSAFAFCFSLANVSIGNGVTSIGDDMFSDCTNLTSVTIPNSVTGIGDSAFASCFSLANVSIGNGVTNIVFDAFEDCSSLVAITVNPVNSAYSSVFGILFDKSQTTLIFCPQGKPGSVAIPNSVISIGDAAFLSCYSLTGVTIPDSVTSIGDGGFENCGLTSITIPNSVTSIGDSAFSESALTRITIPGSVTSIGDAAFLYCTSLKAITVDPNNPAYSSLDGVLFDKSRTTLIQCPQGKAGSFTIPDSVTTIRDDAFEACRLTTVTIGNSVTNIGGYAFAFCRSLTRVYFQGNAPNLGLEAFVVADRFGDYFADPATIYYLPGTTGWGPTFGDLPTIPWTLVYPLILNQTTGFGVQSDQFGFTVSWATNASVVVEANTSLTSPNWSPVATNTLSSGTFYFTDPQWTNYPVRFYRIRSP